jgi:NAD-dependent DNA ligase
VPGNLYGEVVMSGKKSLTALATILLALGAVIVGGQTSQIQAAAWTNPATHSLAALSQPGDEPNINTFTGKIVSQNGVRYILRDEANDTWYHLDDQQQAGKFFGKTVVVTGTLDGRSDMIHIRTISESKS